MSLNEFVADAVQGIGNVIASLIFGQFGAKLRIKHHVQQQVSGFFSNLIDVLVQDGVRELIRFLNGQMTQRLERLLSPTGTFPASRP